MFYFRKQVRAIVKADEIWTQFIQPDLPSREYMRRAFLSHGLGGLYRLFTAVDGFTVVARGTFVTHCCAVDPARAGLFAQCVALCFRLRTCDNSDVSSRAVFCLFHFVQTLLIENPTLLSSLPPPIVPSFLLHSCLDLPLSHSAPCFGTPRKALDVKI